MVEVGDIDVARVTTGILDGMSGMVWPVVWTILGIVIVLFVAWYLMHRHKVRIKMLTSTGWQSFHDKAREVRVDGVKYWRLLKRKDIVPIPPAEATEGLGRDFLGKPRFYAEAYWSEESDYVWSVDSVNKQNLSEKILVDGEKKSVENPFVPFTTQQRALFVSQLRKAESRRKKSLLDQIAQVAVPVVLVMMFIMVLLFWEDIAKPSKEMAELNNQMMERQNAIAASLADISSQNARVVSALADETRARELQIQQQVVSQGEDG